MGGGGKIWLQKTVIGGGAYEENSASGIGRCGRGGGNYARGLARAAGEGRGNRHEVRPRQSGDAPEQHPAQGRGREDQRGREGQARDSGFPERAARPRRR